MTCSRHGSELEATYDPVLTPEMKPELRFESLNHQAAMWVECEVGDQQLSWEFPDVPARSTRTITLPRRSDITEASCQVLARFANGYTEGVDVAMAWRFATENQQGEAEKASVDLIASVAQLSATFEVHSARVQALDAEGVVLFEDSVVLQPRSGRVTVRWRSEGAEGAHKLRITLEGADGESTTYDLEVRVVRG